MMIKNDKNIISACDAKIVQAFMCFITIILNMKINDKDRNTAQDQIPDTVGNIEHLAALYDIVKQPIRF